MTLALLIMAVGGAWADGTVYNSSVDVHTLQPDDILIEGAAITGITSSYAPKIVGYYMQSEDDEHYSKYNSTRALAGSDVQVTLLAGGVIEYLRTSSSSRYTYTPCDAEYNPLNAWIVTQIEDLGSGSYRVQITAYQYEPEITEWNLTSKDGKNWILDKMPASNVELQVEYFAESNLFLSKDALADKTSIAVKAGELGVQFGDDGKSANTITEGTEMTVTYNGTKKILGVNVAKKGGEIDPAKAYLKWDDGQKALVATEIPTTFTTVESANASVIWSAGTYVVEGNVTIGGTIALTGDVDLIIKDGAKLTVNNRISGGNKNLSIYGQANQTGQLVVNYSDGDAIRDITKLEVHSCQVTATSSLDNCGGFFIGTFNVYGGSVDAENTSTDEGGYGIWVNGPMNIYGGDVKAVGKGNRPYTYFGITSSSSTVTVYGGKLWAENAANKALNPSVTLKKDAGFSGKIETSDNGTSWGEYTQDTTPGAPYVRVGY